MTAPADTDPQAPPEARLRCSDADRLTVVHRLQDAVGRGLLTLEECTERTQAAYNARYADELPALTADLPSPVPVAPGWRTVASMAGLQTRMSLLGAGTWSAASARRRRLVVLAGILALLLLFALITASAVGAAGNGPDFGGNYPDWHRHIGGPPPGIGN
jgi:Domain of unknown function (DUF1707)